ncbi:MAG: hypothetical protein Q8N36_03570 [bacterium]|nr:hypothetical protein [bacterium]
MKRTILIIVVATVVLSSIAIVALNLMSAEKDYTGLAVADLPLEEQIKVARSIKLSAVVNWGEGGNLYSREVAEAFLLGYPYPDFLEGTYGKYELISPWEKSRNAMAFLTQYPINSSSITPPIPGAYLREIWLYTNSGVYQIALYLDKDGAILRSSNNFQPAP